MTFSLRKGIPTMQIQYVKKKRGLFSVLIPLCRSLVALPRKLPQIKRRFGILTKFPFAGTVFSFEN